MNGKLYTRRPWQQRQPSMSRSERLPKSSDSDWKRRERTREDAKKMTQGGLWKDNAENMNWTGSDKRPNRLEPRNWKSRGSLNRGDKPERRPRSEKLLKSAKMPSMTDSYNNSKGTKQNGWIRPKQGRAMQERPQSLLKKLKPHPSQLLPDPQPNSKLVQPYHNAAPQMRRPKVSTVGISRYIANSRASARSWSRTLKSTQSSSL